MFVMLVIISVALAATTRTTMAPIRRGTVQSRASRRTLWSLWARFRMERLLLGVGVGLGLDLGLRGRMAQVSLELCLERRLEFRIRN
jgi:hypothetical protein